jgi:hypothetical protein
MNIQSNAMLAQTSISMFGQSKKDKNESNKYAQSHSTTTDSVKVIKTLFDKNDIAEIKCHATMARNAHAKYTLPWNDQGQRLLPCSVFARYQAEMSEYKSNFDFAVSQFVDKYDAILYRNKQRLNGLFNQSDYPTADEIGSRFQMKTSVTPMPKTDDFRVNELSDADIASIKKGYEVEIQEKLKGTQAEILNRFKDLVVHMRDVLKDSDRVFHKSSADKIRDLVALAPKLNVMDDPDLRLTISNLRVLVAWHPDDVDRARSDKRVRSNMAQCCDQAVDMIMDNLGGYAG